MTLTKRIKSLAETKDFTYASLERKAGLGQGTIRKWDINSPSCEKLLAVANLLDTSTDWLLTGEGIMNKTPSTNTPDTYKEDKEYESFFTTDEEYQLLQYYKRLNEIDQAKILERIKTTVELREEAKLKSSSTSNRKTKEAHDEPLATLDTNAG